MADEGGLEIGFGVAGPVLPAEELKNERLFEEVLRFCDDLTLPGETLDSGLVRLRARRS